jgi:hypothetical protein
MMTLNLIKYFEFIGYNQCFNLMFNRIGFIVIFNHDNNQGLFLMNLDVDFELDFCIVLGFILFWNIFRFQMLNPRIISMF